MQEQMKSKQKIKIKRTALTRVLALLMAVIIVGVLAYWVNRQTGNPFSAWYTEKKILAHYDAYHTGEGYVVGPAKYQYVGAGDGTEWKQRYVCAVYKQGSMDTGFTAYYENNAVMQTERATTTSGNNTYNRFKNQMNQALEAAGVKHELDMAENDMLFADFYAPDETQELFNPENPVFKPDSVYMETQLPLPTVVCISMYQEESTQVSDEMLQNMLYELAKACQTKGVAADYYSVQLYSGDGYSCVAMDVPAAELATAQAAADYVAAMPQAEKDGLSQNFYLKTVLSRKYNYLNSCSYEACTHHT